MLKLGQEFSFALKAGGELRVARQPAGQNLKCDVALHGRLIRLVNGSHAPLAQGGKDLIGAKLLAGEIFHTSLNHLSRAAG